MPDHNRLVILGAPGSGKTTLLKALASGVSLRQWEELKERVPLFVSLRAFSQQPDEPGLYQWLVDKVMPELRFSHAESFLDPLLAEPVTLSGQEFSQLVAFLHALTSPSVEDLLYVVPASVPSGLPTSPIGTLGSSGSS